MWNPAYLVCWWVWLLSCIPCPPPPKKKNYLFLIAERCFILFYVCPRFLFDICVLLDLLFFLRVGNVTILEGHFKESTYCDDTMIIPVVSFRVRGDTYSAASLRLWVWKEEYEYYCTVASNAVLFESSYMWIAIKLGKSCFHKWYWSFKWTVAVEEKVLLEKMKKEECSCSGYHISARYV